jgi:hypothetical protein
MAGLKQQKWFLSKFWKPEIRSPVAYRTVLLPKSPGENPSLPFLALVATGCPWPRQCPEASGSMVR